MKDKLLLNLFLFFLHIEVKKMFDQSMGLETENQIIMLEGITNQRFEKSEKKQIWKNLNQNGKLSKSSTSSDIDIAKVLVAAIQVWCEQSGKTLKDLIKQFDKSISSKVGNVLKYYTEKTAKQAEKKQESNQLTQNLYYQQQINAMENEQLKYLNQITTNPNLMNIQLGMQQNSTQPLLTHQYNANQMMTPYLNNFSAFQTTQPQDIYQIHQYAYPALQNSYIHPQNNQGVTQLQQAYIYGRNNTPEMLQSQGLQSTFATTNYIQNPIGNLGYQLNSLPLQQNQQIGYPQFIGTQATTTNTSAPTMDQSRLQNQIYFQTTLNNGFPKIPAADNNYQIDQLALQYQTNQASNQSIQQQKISQNQKQVQAPYQQPNQSQQFQMQQQSQQLQGQLSQQQLQQAQIQQRQNQNSTLKQKQQVNVIPPVNTSSSISTTAVLGNTSSIKQVGTQQILQTGSKNANLGVADLYSQNQQQQQQNQGTSQKQKSKNSNHNSNPQKTSSGNSISGMNNQIHNQYSQQQQLQMRNGAGAYPMKVVENEANKSCICSQLPRLRNQAQELITCKNKNCGAKLHLSCMKISPKDEESIQQFECPSCILKKYDPLHHVELTLVDCQAMMSIQNKQFDFTLTSEVFSKIRDNNDYCVEVRCIRIDGTKNIYETTWPDSGCLKMNNETVLEQKPLQNNSSLKKRKDEKFTFKGTKFLREGINQMSVHEFATNAIEKQQMRITENAVHCISVFVIRRLSPEQLATNIKRDDTRPAEQCKQQILNYFTSQKNGEDDEICIDSLSVNLTCSLDMKLIQTPAKGRFCKHFQCFSLENFILTTETVSPRKWRCNICKAKCYDIVVDQYILKIIQEINEKQIKNVTDVKFDNKGLYSFDQQSYSDDDDDYDDDDSKPAVKKTSSISNQVNTPSTTAASNAAPTYNSNIKRSNGIVLPKGVSIDSHSNSIGVDMQQLNLGQNQQVQNKRKPQAPMIEIESDEEPPVQKKTSAPINQPKQVAASNAFPQQFQPQYNIQQQQQVQQSGNHHHHGIISNNGFGNGINANQGNNGVNNTNLHYANQINSNPSTQISNLINQKNMLQNTSLPEQQIQKNLQISNNSHQTSNSGNNTVNSQNISMIPTINQEKGQSSNQTPINIQTKSKKSILTEDQKPEPFNIQNYINNINKQQPIRSQTNQREQKPNYEEIQNDLNAYKKNNPTSISVPQMNQEIVQQKQQIIQQQLNQQNIQNQNQNRVQQQQEQQQIQKIQNQQQQQIQLQQQQQNKKSVYQPLQPILIDSPTSQDFNEEISTQIQQKQDMQKKSNKFNQNPQSKDNTTSLNCSSFTDFDKCSNNIGININNIQNPFQQQQNQQNMHFQASLMRLFDAQKMEEMSTSEDQTKSNLQVLTEKDIQNIERKRIQCEQRLEEKDNSYFDEFLWKHNFVINQNNPNDLSYRQKLNTSQIDSGNKSQQVRQKLSATSQSPSVLKNIYIQTQINNIINQFQEFSFFNLSCQDDEDEDKQDDEKDDDYCNQNDVQVSPIQNQMNYRKDFVNISDINQNRKTKLDSQQEILKEQLRRDSIFSSEFQDENKRSSYLDKQHINIINIKQKKKIEKDYELDLDLDLDSSTQSNEKTGDIDYIKKLQQVADKIRKDQRIKQNKDNIEIQKSLNEIKNNCLMIPEEQIFNRQSNIQSKSYNQDVQNHDCYSKKSFNVNMNQEHQNFNQKEINDQMLKQQTSELNNSSSHQYHLARNFEQESSETDSNFSNFKNNLNQFIDKPQNLFKNSTQNGAPENIAIKFEKQQGSQKRKIVEKTTSNDDVLCKKRIFEKISGIGAGKVDNPIILDD